MSAQFPHSRRPVGNAGRPLDRAGICDAARPVPCLASEGEGPGHFQSDRAFATLDWVSRTVTANRRTNRLIARIQLGIAGLAVAWAVLPPLCMALVGGAPA